MLPGPNGPEFKFPGPMLPGPKLPGPKLPGPKLPGPRFPGPKLPIGPKFGLNPPGPKFGPKLCILVGILVGIPAGLKPGGGCKGLKGGRMFKSGKPVFKFKPGGKKLLGFPFGGPGLIPPAPLLLNGVLCIIGGLFGISCLIGSPKVDNPLEVEFPLESDLLELPFFLSLSSLPG